MLRFLRLRKAWRKAQKTHQLEHEANIDLSLSCKAVGHLPMIDSYFDYFDKDNQRHFLQEYDYA